MKELNKKTLTLFQDLKFRCQDLEYDVRELKSSVRKPPPKMWGKIQSTKMEELKQKVKETELQVKYLVENYEKTKKASEMLSDTNTKYNQINEAIFHVEEIFSQYGYIPQDREEEEEEEEEEKVEVQEEFNQVEEVNNEEILNESRTSTISTSTPTPVKLSNHVLETETPDITKDIEKLSNQLLTPGLVSSKKNLRQSLFYSPHPYFFLYSFLYLFSK